jgi:hypothetical protein
LATSSRPRCCGATSGSRPFLIRARLRCVMTSESAGSCWRLTIPHSDSSWPDTQALGARQLHGIPADETERITWKNASELYRHTPTS